MEALGERSKPLYRRVAEDITAKIDAGVWHAGTRLPSERALCERYQVSQITVRRALRELAHRGHVLSRHGLGWFVRQSTVAVESSREVTLVLPSLNSLLAPTVCSFVERVQPAGVAARMVFSDGGADSWGLMLKQAVAQGADAIVLVTSEMEQAAMGTYADALADISVPILFLPQEVADLDIPAAVLDQQACMERLTRHILSLGHRHVAYAGSDASRMGGWQCYWGFATTLWGHDLDLPLDWVFSYPLTEEEEARRFQRVFDAPRRPSALVCSSDNRAAEALHLLRGLGLQCPSDVAIVGMGDCEYAPLLSTPLTTFRLDLRGLGLAAADMLLDLMAGHPVENVRVSGQLIVRESCGAGLANPF